MPAINLNFTSLTHRLERQYKIVLGALAAIVLLLAAGLTLRYAAERRAEAFLTGHGVGQTLIFSGRHFGGGSIVLADIKLDADGDSTIGDIRAIIRWPFLLSSRPFSRVIIDHLVLAGTVDEDGHLLVSGFKTGPLLPLVEADNVLLNSGRLDLATPEGDLQFSMKGSATRQPDGSFKTDAAFWGNQYQMALDTRWQGMTRPDGTWTAAADIREMKGNFIHAVWSRVNGWLKIDGDRTGPLAAVGQLRAGQIKLGTRTVIADAAMTLDGPLLERHMIFKGAVPAWPGMTLLVETRLQMGRTSVRADIAGRSAMDLLGFLTALNSDVRLAMPRSTIMTSLLLTQGNVNRLVEAARAAGPAKSAELMIDGEAGNLNGKIIVHRASKPDALIALRPGHL